MKNCNIAKTYGMSKENNLIKEIFSENCNQNKIDTAYLAIDWSKKTELTDKRGNTVFHTTSWKSLLQFAEETLIEEIP